MLKVNQTLLNKYASQFNKIALVAKNEKFDAALQAIQQNPEPVYVAVPGKGIVGPTNWGDVIKNIINQTYDIYKERFLFSKNKVTDKELQDFKISGGLLPNIFFDIKKFNENGIDYLTLVNYARERSLSAKYTKDPKIEDLQNKLNTAISKFIGSGPLAKGLYLAVDGKIGPKTDAAKRAIGEIIYNNSEKQKSALEIFQNQAIVDELVELGRYSAEQKAEAAKVTPVAVTPVNQETGAQTVQVASLNQLAGMVNVLNTFFGRKEIDNIVKSKSPTGVVGLAAPDRSKETLPVACDRITNNLNAIKRTLNINPKYLATLQNVPPTFTKNTIFKAAEIPTTASTSYTNNMVKLANKIYYKYL